MGGDPHLSDSERPFLMLSCCQTFPETPTQPLKCLDLPLGPVICGAAPGHPHADLRLLQCWRLSLISLFPFRGLSAEMSAELGACEHSTGWAPPCTRSEGRRATPSFIIRNSRERVEKIPRGSSGPPRRWRQAGARSRRGLIQQRRDSRRSVRGVVLAVNN